MATSSVTNSTNGANFIMALGGGSGVDIKALAENLVNAEKQPKAELIQKSIDKNQARITGFDVILRAVTQIRETLDSLAAPSTFSSFTASSTIPTAVSISGSPTADTAPHEVRVTRLAQAQRSVSAALTSGSPVGTSPLTVAIDLNATGDTKTVQVTDNTPEGIVSAINSQGWPVKASLVYTEQAGTGPAQIVLTGESGLENAFTATVTTAANTSAVSFSTLQGALNSEAWVDGVKVERSGNIIEGAITGATLSLTALTGTSSAVVSLARDIAPVKDKLQQLVSSYNDLQAIIDAAQDPNSTVEKLGASLVGDPTIRSIRDRIRSILMPPSGSSIGTQTAGGAATPFVASGSSSLTGLRSLGVMIGTDGRMQFATLKEYDPLNPKQDLLKVGDETTLNETLAGNFDEVVAMFQGRNGSPGIASDMSDLISGDGRYMDTSFTPSSPIKTIIATQRNASGYVRADQDRLSALEDRMQALLDRYIRQFAIMDSLVGESKSTKTGIENSFKGMTASRG